MKSFIDILETAYQANAPIFMEDIIDAFPDTSRQTLYRRINTELEKGTLARFERGIYYIPTKTRFGKSLLDPDKVIEKKWIRDNGEIIGYISGANLANRVGISEQVPATLEITTNKETTRVREVSAFGGWKSIVLRKPRKPIADDNVKALQFLDIITNEPVSSMSDYAIDALKKLAAVAGRSKVYECAAEYPQRTSKQLVDCELKNVFA